MEDNFEPLLPDLLTPSQFADLHRSANGDDIPVRRLLIAALEDALRDAVGLRAKPTRRKRKHDAANKVRKQRRNAESLDWIFDDGGDGLFAFRNLCDGLGVDADWLRARVRERLAERRAA